MDTNPDPHTLLRHHHRQLLDRQAAIGIEIRTIGARLDELTTELANITTAITHTAQLLNHLRTPPTPKPKAKP